MSEEIFTPAEDAEFIERARTAPRVEFQPMAAVNMSEDEARRAAQLFG